MTAIRLADFIKAYDIRGVVGEQLTPAVFRALGSAFAEVVVLPEGHCAIVLGFDMRPSSAQLAQAFADGVREAGVTVRQIGLCATDQVYFASGRLDLPGAMVTASHNPARYNGLKLCRRRAAPVGLDDGLREIRDLAQADLDARDEQALADSLPAHRPRRHAGTTAESAVDVGAHSGIDIEDDYVDYLYSLVDLSGIRPLRVVVDAGNGMGGLSAPAVLRSGRVPIEMVGLYLELDGTFPHHAPNPLDPANLVDLGQAVRSSSADLGLAFDGDADRCFVVDERGRPVSASAISALVALEEIAAEVRRGVPVEKVTVVHNAVTSMALPQAIAATGANPVVAKVGHVYIKQAMAAHRAVFGAEHSGHYYFRDFWYADTGMLMALRVLGALGRTSPERTFSDLVAPHQGYYESGEVNFVVADVAAADSEVLTWAMAQDGDLSVDRVDGLTVLSQAQDGRFWRVSLRSSNTEPLVRLNVEADREAAMVRVRDALADILAVASSTPSGEMGTVEG